MDSLSVIVEDDPNPIVIPDAAVDYFELVKELSVISSGPIKLNLSKKVFNKILEFGTINRFVPLKVATVKTSSLKQALEGDQKNYDFISEFQGSTDPQLAKLFKGAQYIKCQSLMTLIAVVIACDIYFGDCIEQYNSVKEKFKIKDDITYAEDQEYKRNFVYMN